VLLDYSRELRRHILTTAIPKAVTKQLEWLEREQWDVLLATKAGPIIGGYLEAGGASGVAQVHLLVEGTDYAGAVFSFDVQNPQIQEYLETQPLKFAAKINDTLDVELRKQLAEGIAVGESHAELAKRIDEKFDEWDKGRARIIAKTEETRATQAGHEAAWKQTGVIGGKRWRTTANACEWCAPLNGKIAELGGAYYEQGTVITHEDRHLKLDYETVGLPPLHPGCNCYVEPMLIGEE